MLTNVSVILEQSLDDVTTHNDRY